MTPDLETTQPIPELVTKRYKPHGHNVDVEIVAPWLEVREVEDGRSVLHDTDNCHCVKCCVAYRTRYQVMCSMMNDVTDQLRAIKSQVQILVDAGSKTDRRTPQDYRDDLINGPGAWLSPVERTLRKMLAFRCSEYLYGDDGELHDSQMPFPIDYMRDSVDMIRHQLEQRALAKLHAAS